MTFIKLQFQINQLVTLNRSTLYKPSINFILNKYLYIMLFAESLPFIKAFIEKLNKGIEKHQPGSQLSFAQRAWLSFCLTGILITNSVCWAKFERASLGTYSVRALSWMFRYSSIPWEFLLQNSVILILEEYGLTEGVLVVDESDKKRSKSANSSPS